MSTFDLLSLVLHNLFHGKMNVFLQMAHRKHLIYSKAKGDSLNLLVNGLQLFL